MVLAEFRRLRFAHVTGSREATPGASEREQSTPLPHPHAFWPSDWHTAKERKVSTFLRVHSCECILKIVEVTKGLREGLVPRDVSPRRDGFTTRSRLSSNCLYMPAVPSMISYKRVPARLLCVLLFFFFFFFSFHFARGRPRTDKNRTLRKRALVEKNIDSRVKEG